MLVTVRFYMCFLENKPKLTLILPVARSGRVYLPYKPLFQASLKSALSAKFTTLRVTDIIRNKHKKHYNVRISYM